MHGRFRHLVAGTTALTVALILIGVYTGAAGAGLTCAGRWPFCDGWLGLFPATVPSFIEWFHRLVALVTGFAILGTTYLAWRDGHDRRIVRATQVATLVLPAQILLGANTIINFGAVSQVLHHAAALGILVPLVAATAWAYTEAEEKAPSAKSATGPDRTASQAKSESPD